MKRYLFFIFTMLLLYVKVNGQLDLYIKELNVYHVKDKWNKDFYISTFEDGPKVIGKYCFKNNSDSIINLISLDSEWLLTFNYKGINFEHEFIYITHRFSDKKILLPGQELIGDFEDYLVLGTIIWKEKTITDDGGYIVDYTDEMLEILPTIRIWYKDKNLNIDIKSTAILSVKIY